MCKVYPNRLLLWLPAEISMFLLGAEALPGVPDHLPPASPMSLIFPLAAWGFALNRATTHHQDSISCQSVVLLGLAHQTGTSWKLIVAQIKQETKFSWTFHVSLHLPPPHSNSPVTVLDSGTITLWSSLLWSEVLVQLVVKPT